MNLIFMALVFLSSGAWSSPIPHLDLEMTSREYRSYLQANNLKSALTDPQSIQQALKLGERLAQWIEFENKHRSPDSYIRLTSPGTRTGIPIDKPKIYSDKTVETDLKALLAEFPASLKAVIVEENPFPEKLPLADQDFIVLGRKLDRIYQTAARYKSLVPYKLQYENRAKLDVRGYYYLQTNKWDEQRLSDVTTIEEAEGIKVKAALVGLCLNNSLNLTNCQKQVNEAWIQNKVAVLFKNWISKSQSIWKNFFNIPGGAARNDIDYREEVVMNVPFNTPSISKFKPYLKDNIEDEWRFQNWNLKLIFGDYANGPTLTFQTGVVPHVNGLGGNEIVMDSNQSIEEYESKWTIRHEFGHVLGFPDCYHEFYDSNLQAFVNYQLDTTDLMCSRAGNMNERLYKELKRTYFH